jgi:hypothetical protein
LQQAHSAQPSLQHAALSLLQQPQHLSPAMREMLPASSVVNNPNVIITFFIAVLLFCLVPTSKLCCDRREISDPENTEAQVGSGRIRPAR